MTEIINTIQTMTPQHWIITILCSLIAITSQWLLANIIDWYQRTDYKFRISFDSTIYSPVPTLEVVTNDTDESIGVCSLMTITYLLATNHDISLYGYLSNPITRVDTIVNGPITLREWIIALKNFNTKSSEELLEYLEEHGISTDPIKPYDNYKDTLINEVLAKQNKPLNKPR